MALIIADRVKETTITQGTGTITLSGSTFGGFQSFSDAIGEGNSTYYCIQNESNFEIGIGTFSSGSLSRDTVLESSNSDAKISIVGTAVVFCVIPSQKLIFKDENDNVTLPQDLTIDDLSVDYISAASGDFSGPLTSNSFSSSLVSANDIIATDSLNSSGLLTLRRESAGNFFHAYIDDSNDRTISLYSDGLTPTWRLGLKSSPSSETEAPSYGYIYASDGEFGIVGNMNNKVTMSNATPFCVQHQGQNIIQAHYLTGVHLDSMTSAFPALVVNGGISLSANIQEWDTYDGTTLSVVDNQGFFGIRNDNPSYQLDVTGTGSFSQAVRFGDGTLQTTAGIPYASGSLIDQNAANLISQSGYFQSYVDIRDAAISGNLQSQIDQNVSDISATSGYFESRVDSADATAVSHSGYFESRVDSADSNITANSGYFESRVDQLDSDVSYVSGVAVYGSGHNLQTVSDNGASTTNALTITNNNITASSGLFDSLDMTPLAEANYPAHQEGVVFYDVDNHTLSLYNDEADVTLQLGQEEFLRVRNNTGATITNGTAVLITGSHGNAAPTISGAIATSESASQIVGLATHDIEHNSFGYVTTYGIVRNVDTSHCTAGDEIFLSATDVGSGVNVSPTIPNYKVTIGHVIRSHRNNGSILVQIGHPKLGGGDLKSEAELNVSGVPFVTTKSDTTAGGSQTDPLFIFDSGNRQLQLGSGLQLLDGQPSNTTNVLYNDGGDLYFNGSEIGVSGESLDFAGNILTYNNSKGGSFTADLSSLSTFDTSGVSLAYSAGTLTYTNNAGGSFDVDLSSISGDVYALIVDGAPATLDTLNEIAAALNDDANVANTLTSLISTTSGNLQSQITSNDGDITQLNSDIATVSGLLYDDSAVSGYFESRVDQADTDIATVSGLLYDDSAVSGYFESRVDQADSDILAVSGLIGDADFLPGSSGGLVDQNAEDIITVSGLLASVNPTGTPSGISFFDDAGSLSGNSSLVFDGQNITLDGYIDASGQRVITSEDIHHIVQLTQAEYDALTPDSATFYIITDAPSISGYFESRVDQADADIATVSGLLDSVNPTGTPSGISFFDDSGSLSGNNTFIYDGVDVSLSGNITASGKRVITSEEVHHIQKLTQSEYDALTPDAATFYIITDPDVEGPVVQPYREVSTSTSILSTDYTVNATAGLTLSLPSAAGNGGIIFNIKNTGTGNVVVSGVGGNTIDGQPSFEISTQYQSIKVQSTNSNWIIL